MIDLVSKLWFQISQLLKSMAIFRKKYLLLDKKFSTILQIQIKKSFLSSIFVLGWNSLNELMNFSRVILFLGVIKYELKIFEDIFLFLTKFIIKTFGKNLEIIEKIIFSEGLQALSSILDRQSENYHSFGKKTIYRGRQIIKIQDLFSGIKLIHILQKSDSLITKKVTNSGDRIMGKQNIPKSYYCPSINMNNCFDIFQNQIKKGKFLLFSTYPDKRNWNFFNNLRRNGLDNVYLQKLKHPTMTEKHNQKIENKSKLWPKKFKSDLFIPLKPGFRHRFSSLFKFKKKKIQKNKRDYTINEVLASNSFLFNQKRGILTNYSNFEKKGHEKETHFSRLKNILIVSNELKIAKNILKIFEN